jgi:general stress protein YciG
LSIVQVDMDDIDTSGHKRRGFASMSPEKRRQMASMGGKAVPKEKRAYARDPDLASRSGKKGGAAIRVVTYKSRSDML